MYVCSRKLKSQYEFLVVIPYEPLSFHRCKPLIQAVHHHAQFSARRHRRSGLQHEHCVDQTNRDRRAKDESPFKKENTKIYYGVLSIIFLLLYFVFPDSSSGGSYISVRLNILFFLVFCIWLSLFNYPDYLRKLIFLVILIAWMNAKIE